MFRAWPPRLTARRLARDSPPDSKAVTPRMMRRSARKLPPLSQPPPPRKPRGSTLPRPLRRHHPQQRKLQPPRRPTPMTHFQPRTPTSRPNSWASLRDSGPSSILTTSSGTLVLLSRTRRTSTLSSPTARGALASAGDFEKMVAQMKEDAIYVAVYSWVYYGGFAMSALREITTVDRELTIHIQRENIRYKEGLSFIKFVPA
jgi:hypothetical protein